MTTTRPQLTEATPVAPPAGPTSTFAGKRQLRNFLLDRMQLRYTGIIVLISATLTAGLGYFVFRNAREASETVKVTLLEKADDPATLRLIQERFDSGDRAMLLLLVGFGIVLCIALGLFGIVVTHKVAGPLFKISHSFAAVRDGHLKQLRQLRRGDQLQDFFEHYKEMLESLRVRTGEEVATLTRVIAALEECGPPDTARPHIEALKELKRKKEESLT